MLVFALALLAEAVKLMRRNDPAVVVRVSVMVPRSPKVPEPVVVFTACSAKAVCLTVAAMPSWAAVLNSQPSLAAVRFRMPSADPAGTTSSFEQYRALSAMFHVLRGDDDLAHRAPVDGRSQDARDPDVDGRSSDGERGVYGEARVLNEGDDLGRADLRRGPARSA